MSTWREFLNGEMLKQQDDGPVVAVAPNPDVLDVQFDDGYGLANGPEVLIWTKKRVYFPCVYDGAEWLGSAPRYPTSKGQPHEGGQ